MDPSTYEFVNRSMKKRDSTRLVDGLVQSYRAPMISQVLDAFKDNEVGQAVSEHLDELKPIFMMAKPGARGSFPC